MRRAVDLIGALLASIATAPVLAGAAVAVAFDVGRPVLFVQARSGRGGRIFRMAKLRTMTDARDPGGMLLPDRQRLTRLGAFLRRSRIDELPGLWHIVLGDMALIGPRPLLPVTIAAMGSDGSARGAVRPGLTGWAQVNGNALLSDKDKVRLDLWYIDHVSFRLDLAILLKTVRVVVFGERLGAANHGRAYAGRHRRSG